MHIRFAWQEPFLSKRRFNTMTVEPPCTGAIYLEEPDQLQGKAQCVSFVDIWAIVVSCPEEDVGELSH